MNPILLGRQAVRGLKALVHENFPNSSPAFAGMIERFVEDPKNYVKGPWISAAMPFQQSSEPGAPFEQPFPEVPLAFAPYRHQEAAFARLSGAEARSTLIATGTGSGKTESYLWPILDHCRARKGEPGVKAILIYPMNALATDQARRIARAIHETPALQGVRAGIYADAEPDSPADDMTRDGPITRRAAMWATPPDILLTNYKMLDYLLLRAQDQKLWAKNAPESLRFLVVDEMHAFDGAQGADLALLIRRVKDRLKTPPGGLICVGASATLGSGEEAARDLRAYAEKIFGERFDAGSVIREARKTPEEALPQPEYFDWPKPEAAKAALEAALKGDQAQAARRLARVLFPEETDQETGFLHHGDPASPVWRIALGKLMREHVAAQRTLRILGEAGGPLALERLAEEMGKIKALAKSSLEGRMRIAELVVALLAWARSGAPEAPQPLFGLRVQIWAREMARMTATLPSWSPEGGRTSIHLRHGHDLDEAELRRTLPVVICSRCGTAAHLGRRAAAGEGLWARLEDLYADFFNDDADRLRLIYHESVLKPGLAGSPVLPGLLHAETLEFSPHDPKETPEPGPKTPVWLYNPVNRAGRLDRSCPACGHAHSLLLFGLRAARMTAALAETLYNSEQNEENPEEKPRLLLFSDSVQDAAQRAAVVELRNGGAVLRKALRRALARSETRGLDLKEIVEDLPRSLEAEMGPEAFVATFISKQQTWRQPFQNLLANKPFAADPAEAEAAERFCGDVRLRLGWEFFSDLTYRSHTSQTLEMAGLVAAEADPERVRDSARRFAARLPVKLGPNFVLPEETAALLLAGLLRRMRRGGAVGHEYVLQGMEAEAPRGGVNYFAAGQRMGLGKTGTLPQPDSRRGAAPSPVSLGGSGGYESLNRDHAANWHRDWLDKLLIPIWAFAPAHYDQIFAEIMDRLEADGLLLKVLRKNGDHGYVLKPEAVIVSQEVVHLRCEACRRTDAALAGSPLGEGSLCARIACKGRMKAEAAPDSEHRTSLLDSNRLHRVVAREHTGLLESDERRRIETGFIAGKAPWTPNLISATPTLEMGIDIGALSTLLLCSVPPEEANYIQRIGRTGRRDGNSLNVTFANARPHDLQFWEEPEGMLEGRVRPPGVHLEAVAVLRRQMTAFTLDRFVAAGLQRGDYGKLRPALTALEQGRTAGFPMDWFAFVRKSGAELAEDFLAMLPEAVAARPEIRKAAEAHLAGEGETSLIWLTRSIFDEAAQERKRLIGLRKQLDAESARLNREKHLFTPEELKKRLDALQGEKGEINHMIRKDIDERAILQFLTDRGALPNYAFPEEGVKFTSILVRHAEKGQPRRADGEDLRTLEYRRPASSALSEFAPGQSFYAEGRELRIDRLEINPRDWSKWRFCPSCSFAEQEAVSGASGAACPKCGDEMWIDAGSKHEVVELRSVLAVTQEQKAAIRDRDDRILRLHDRLVLPFFKPEAIEASWLAKGGGGSAPFGLEFISACEFRDFNFGETASAGLGPRIAGEERRARAFPICGHCGRLQERRRRSPEAEEEIGDHQLRCPVLRTPALARGDWEREVFLMRKFLTETIRIMIPVVGQADHDEIKSFVAAINLGMRRYFSGKVDHIRSVVVETRRDEMSRMRSLHLYDAVPGGSGYLRQLAEDPKSMRAVVAKAAEALQNCPCAAEGRTGCFRCVKSYRTQFGPGEPDRDSALRMMQSILAQWESLERVEGGIEASLFDGLVESELEKRFLETLVARFGADRLRPHVLAGGKKGFILDPRAEKRGALWTIETQVQIDKRFHGLPKKRVDFLLTPTGGGGAKPIVVEMDGLKHHAATVDQDLLARILMIRSGELRVWTLGWEDLEAGAAEPLNPLSGAALGETLQGRAAQALTHPALRPLAEEVGLLMEGASLELLLRTLSRPDLTLAPAASTLARLIVGKGAEPGASPFAGLSEDSRSFLQAEALSGFCAAGPLALHLAVDRLAPAGWPQGAGGLRVVLRAAPIAAALPTEVWRGLWRLVNLLQDLRGLHVEFPGLDTLSAPSMSAAPAEDLAWEEVFALTDASFHPLLRALIAARIPPPDEIGRDLTGADGAVVGMAELCWSAARLAICETALEVPGWSLLRFDPADAKAASSLREIASRVLEILEGVS